MYPQQTATLVALDADASRVDSARISLQKLDEEKRVLERYTKGRTETDLEAKVAAHPDRFAWDFIGQLQSRKVKQIVAHVRLIHSLASESALAQLERHADAAAPGLEALVEVNVSGEQDKAGVAPEALEEYLARAPVGGVVPITGLMTMPPLADDPEASRPYFARLRELARAHGLERLSMGTTQDFAVAVEEGATIVRIGTRLYA